MSEEKKKKAAPVAKGKTADKKRASEAKTAKAKRTPKSPSESAKPAKKGSVKETKPAETREVPGKIEISNERAFPGSSRAARRSKAASEVLIPEPAAVEPSALEGMSPLERKLAEPVLPELPRENRARLQMQSPTRIYFYWSIKNNPYKTLTRAFGGVIENYSLVVRLVNHTNGTEEMHRAEPEGNWWFNVLPDCVYRAEVGFYAPNRPYVRIIFSNYLKTPRKNPSRRTDYVPRFTVSADQFAEVLDKSGYSRDAFEVALAGDDHEAADESTRSAYSRLLGTLGNDFGGFDGDDLRFVLLALASGYTIEDLKGHISQALYESLVASGVRVSSEQALAALKEHFDVETEDVTEEEEIGPAVFGLSAVHFPKRLRTRTVPRKLASRLSRFENISSSR